MMFWRLDIDRFANIATARMPGDFLRGLLTNFTNPLWRAGRSATPALAAGAEGDQEALHGHA
jgi:hypothetical protein